MSTEAYLPGEEDAEDKRLMERVAQGDDDALRLLVECHHPRLVGYLKTEVGSLATAEELAMEVFIRLHRSAPRWRPEAKLSTYLFHIAHNLVLNEWRRKSRKPTHSIDALSETGDHHQESARRVGELEESFARALQQIPPEQRTALTLLVQQDMTYEEISTVMKVPVSTVKTWIFRARTQLKNLLKDHYGTH
jgi:RNA polymerase sigma-70 factor (ECF subfamily)